MTAPDRSRPMWQLAAIGMLGVLVLAGLFFVGTLLPGILNPSAKAPSQDAASQDAASQDAAGPTASLTPTPTPRPTSTAGPQLAGTYEWFELRGGECISPFTSAWQQRFTVVDCQAAHSAQVVTASSLAPDSSSPYPGQAAIAERLNLLCQQPGSFDPSILGTYPDIVWQAAYPVNDAQWQAGQRNYYCFVSRSSSSPLVGNFAAAASSG